MTTTSQSAVIETIRARLLSYTFGGTDINTLTAGRVYIDWPPDNAPFPCAVMRIANWQRHPDFSVARMFTVEIMVYGRGRNAANARTVKQIADLCEQALETFMEASADLGLTWGDDHIERETVPPPTEEFDREVMAERLAASGVCYPRYLTDVLAP